MSSEESKSIEAELQSIVNEPDLRPQPIKSKSFYTKARIIFTTMTVEPILVLYVLPSVMATLATQNLSLEKACRVNLEFNQSICDEQTLHLGNSTNSRNYEEAIQKLVANMTAWMNIVQSLIPSILLLFLGSWSDRTKRRKPCIILPIIGEMCSCIGLLFCTYFFYQLPMEVNGFFEAVPPAITGGGYAVFMGVFSYISGISSKDTRTLRIGAVNMFSNVSKVIGIALSGILYKLIGFYGVFLLALIMYITGILYGIRCVRENVAEKPKRNVVKDFFDWKHIRGTFKVAFKEGARNRKRRICMIMILVMVIIGPLHGEIAVVYLFVRYKFGWNEMQYSLFSTFQFIFQSCGTLFSLFFFTKFLKVDDAVLGMISSASKICACLVYAFVPTGRLFYLGVIVEVLNGTSFIAMRSIISKLVPPDELGKINSLFGVCEALMPLVYGPLYSKLYSFTINILPGAFFLLGGALTIPAIIIFYWLYREHQRDRLEEEKERAQKENLLEEK